MKLLHIDSSITGAGSVSRQLTARVADSWRERFPGLEVTYRDLAAAPLHHFSLETSEPEILAEFLAADVVVIGAPMYNFTIPSQLKAWLDRLVVAGTTFTYGPEGPVGLAGGRKVIVVSSRGGIYSDGVMDFQERYLTSLLGFLGITDLEFVRAEGVKVGEDGRARALAQAERMIA